MGVAPGADISAPRRPWRLPDAAVLGAFLVPALLLLAATQFWPLLNSAWISLHDWTLSRSPVMGSFVGLENYARVLSDAQFTGSFAFTAALALGSTALSLSAGFALALLTFGDDWRLRTARALFLFLMVIAPVAVGTIWRMILAARVGTLNQGLEALGLPSPNWLGDPLLARISLTVIDAWQWTPFVMIIMAAALTSLPQDVLRAAAMDGAGRGLILRRIVFPMVLPALVLVAMFRLIDALTTLDIVFTTTGGGPGFATQTLSFCIYQQGLRYFNISTAAAASWLLLALCFTVALGFLAWRRHMMRWQGMSGSGVSVWRWTGIVLTLLVALFPFLILILNSLRPADDFLRPGAGLFPDSFILEHYRAVFGGDGEMLRFLLNSLIVTAATTVIAVAIGTLAAYALARLRLPFRLPLLIGLLFLVVRFYPKITVALPCYLLMRDLGWLDSHVAVILAHASITVPFVVWLMLGFFEELPREIELSAMMDGCGAWMRFRRIVLPLSLPALGAAATLTAFVSWNEFLMASTVAVNEAKTLPVRVSSFITDKGIQWGNMAAMSTVIVLPVAAFALWAQRWLARGLTAGAVKG